MIIYKKKQFDVEKIELFKEYEDVCRKEFIFSNKLLDFQVKYFHEQHYKQLSSKDFSKMKELENEFEKELRQIRFNVLSEIKKFGG